MRTPGNLLENPAYLQKPPDSPVAGTRYAGVYARESVDKSGERLAVSRQLDDLLPLAAADGYVPVVYSDNDIGSSDPSKPRPEWQRMLSDLRAGKLHTVATWDESRLFRNDLEQAEFISAAQKLKLPRILFVVGGAKDLNDYNDAFMFRVINAMNTRHVEEMKAKQQRAFRQRADLGRAWWANRPFGYEMPNRDGTGATIREDEAAAIRGAYAAILKGRALKEIARDWDAAGLRTPERILRKAKKRENGSTLGGDKWNPLRIRQVLVNPRNAGIRTYRGEEVCEGNWPPIVDEPTFRAVVGILNSNARTPNAWVRKYLLSGLAACGACGHTMAASTRGKKSDTPVYRCNKCNRVYRQVIPVDNLVKGAVVRALEADGDTRSLMEHRDVDFTALRAELADLDTAETELAEMLVRRELKRPAFLAAQKLANARRAEIEAEIAAALSKEVIGEAYDVEDIYVWFDGLPLDRQRAIIDRLVSVTIMPGQNCRGPFDGSLVVLDWKG